MHKQAYLPSSANYAGMELQLDALARQNRDQASQIISVATSFGRAVVAKRVPAADAETWAAGLAHQANDHRYYELTHDALGHQFEHYYLLLKDHTDKTRAIQPFLMVKQDLVSGLPKALRRSVDKIRQRFPAALVMRMLMVGCSAGEGTPRARHQHRQRRVGSRRR